MNEMYVGLFAFLVSTALLVVGCHVGIYLEQRETILQERPTQAQTSNRDIADIHTSMPASTIVSSVLQTQRWPSSRTEFRGFNSPRGRF